MTRVFRTWLTVIVLGCLPGWAWAQAEPLRAGSKRFTKSSVLAEVIA